MRILFTLINFPPSNFGGIASCMYNVLKELSNNLEYDLKVLTTTYKIKSEKLPKTNCWTYYNEIPINYIKTTRPSFSLNYLYEGFCQIKKSDQIYLSSFFFFPNLIFLIIGLIYNKKIILLPHGELFNLALKRKYWKKGIYLLLVKILSRKISFITTSDQEASEIKHIFLHSNVSVIPNFFTLGSPLRLEKLNQLLFLGRICKIKKIENLILACSISKYFLKNNYKLIIAGPTDNEFLKYEARLKNLVDFYNLNNNIEFIGEVLSPIKERLLSQSKALFVVSDSENFSNVVVESLAQGTPVVASTGTPWRSLIERKSGYWVDNSPESVALKIDEIILLKDDAYKAMSSNSLSLSKEFSKNNILPMWLKIIKEQ